MAKKSGSSTAGMAKRGSVVQSAGGKGVGGRGNSRIISTKALGPQPKNR